jgi:hypothetical protein
VLGSDKKGSENRMSKEARKSKKLGAIIRELNKRHEAFLKAVAEDIHERAKK